MHHTRDTPLSRDGSRRRTDCSTDAPRRQGWQTGCHGAEDAERRKKTGETESTPRDEGVDPMTTRGGYRTLAHPPGRAGDRADLGGGTRLPHSATQAFRLVDRRRARTGEELDQSSTRGGILRLGSETDREDRRRLQLGRQRPDDLDAGHREELRDLSGGELDLAAGDHLTGPGASILVLRGDELGEAEALDRPREGHAGGAVTRITYRRRGDDRALQRLGRADGGLRCTRLDRQTDSGTGDVGLGCRDDLAGL